MLISDHMPVEHYFLTQTGAAILLVDEFGKILRANGTCEKLFGKALKASTVFELFGEREVFHLAERAVEPNRKYLVNFRLNRDRPLTYYFVYLAVPDGYLCIGEEDHDELENLRHALIDANGEVNNLMREVSVQNKELAKLNQMKNQFLGMAAHDLRNPINVLNGYADYLLHCSADNLTPKQLGVIESMKKAADFMLSLLNSFLDISKIEAGKLELNKSRFDLRAKLQQIVAAHQMLAAKKKIKLCFDAPAGALQLNADEDKIEQVVTNLLSNAIKYSEPNRQVDISVFDTGEQNQVILCVRDQGPGISPEDREKLFNPYATGASKTTASETSTGLGLAIVQKIVIAHQGKVWVESKPGEGSAFYVSLPMQ